MEGPSPQPPDGLFALARRAADILLGVLTNRLELVSVELQEEKLRIVDVLVWAGLLLFFSFMGMVLLTATVILLLEDTARQAALIFFTLLYFGGAALALFRIKGRLREGPRPFADTLSELKKDREWLKHRK